MRGAWLSGLFAASLFLLGGCAQLPGFRSATPLHKLELTKPPESFRLEGRVSVKTGEESFSGGMLWRHGAKEEALLLRTPLGQGVAELRGTGTSVSLKDAEGRLYFADDAEELVRKAVGMTLPLKGLSWWVVGHPRPHSRYTAEADEEGRLAVLHQDDWRIEFSRYAPYRQASQGPISLPGKLIARRGDDLEIRLVVDEWELP